MNKQLKQSELEEWKEKHDNVYTVIIETIRAEHDESQTIDRKRV